MTHFGNYINSVRTPGEVKNVFIRDIEVVCKMFLFIENKNTFFFIMQE
jgi:hypothetical protein